MKRFALLLPLVFLLVACTSSPVTTDLPTSQPFPIPNIPATSTDDPALVPTLFPNMNGNGELICLDEQGAVIFEVTPLNLGTPADTLEFDVAMNTHSVELSMDLATLSTLTIVNVDAPARVFEWELK